MLFYCNRCKKFKRYANTCRSFKPKHYFPGAHRLSEVFLSVLSFLRPIIRAQGT